VLGYLADRATKIWALNTLDPANPPSYLGGFLKLRLIFNPGAAFSLGSNATVALSLLASTAFCFVLVGVVPRAVGFWQFLTTGLLLAGISGNLTDRLTRPPGILRGEVVDFISLPHFAIFNVADMCITGSAILICVIVMFTPDESRKAVSHRSTESQPQRDGARPV